MKVNSGSAGSARAVARGAALIVVILGVAMTGCGARTGGAGGGEGTPPRPAKVVLLDWAIERVGSESDEPPRTAVALTLTDETGSARTESLGKVTGACTEWGQAELARYPGTLLGLSCFYAGSGTDFRVVHSTGKVVVLRMLTDEQIEDASFEEHRSFAVPTGTAVRAAP